MSLYEKALDFAQQQEWLKGIAVLDTMLREIEQIETKQIAFLYYQKAYFYSEAAIYESAISSLTSACTYYQIAQDSVNCLLSLVFKSKLFLELQENAKAIVYLNEASHLLLDNQIDLQVYVYETMALAWYEMNCLDKALYYWQRCYTLVSDVNEKQQYAVQSAKIQAMLFL